MITLPLGGSDKPYEIKPTKIIALGLNYREHVRESVSAQITNQPFEIPKEPVLFAKTSNCLIGPGDPIVLPLKFLGRYGFETIRNDYEAELAFVVGRRCRSIKASEAFDYILGFTCMNDVSQRNIQNSDKSGWFRGKSFDTFGPIGPRIVPLELVGNPQDLAITCRLNGLTVQQARTSDMIFGIAETLAFISEQITLEPGDIVTTGTPSGVGPVKPGDVVEVEVENIGILKNPVKADA